MKNLINDLSYKDLYRIPKNFLSKYDSDKKLYKDFLRRQGFLADFDEFNPPKYVPVKNNHTLGFDSRYEVEKFLLTNRDTRHRLYTEDFEKYKELWGLKKDFWEEYITPWIRTINVFIYYAVGPHADGEFIGAWEKYLEKKLQSFDWTNYFLPESNISFVHAGKAAFCLYKYIKEDFSQYWEDQYAKYITKFIKVANFYISSRGCTEGVLYGSFALSPVVGLSYLHEITGNHTSMFIKYLFDENYRYLQKSQIKEGYFQIHGDSRPNEISSDWSTFFYYNFAADNQKEFLEENNIVPDYNKILFKGFKCNNTTKTFKPPVLKDEAFYWDLSNQNAVTMQNDSTNVKLFVEGGNSFGDETLHLSSKPANFSLYKDGIPLVEPKNYINAINNYKTYTPNWLTAPVDYNLTDQVTLKYNMATFTATGIGEKGKVWFSFRLYEKLLVIEYFNIKHNMKHLHKHISKHADILLLKTQNKYMVKITWDSLKN